MENTFQRIYAQVKKIPAGKVATYGQIAMMAGNPHLSQIVGYALHANPDPSTIPCHRIVNRFGKLAKAFVFGGENRQRELLLAEGITFIDDNTVDLKKHIYSEE